MSINAMNLVWQNFPRGGSEKLTLLALADWCDDNGENLYPSISKIARKICTTEGQARRIIHGFIEDGYLAVVGNHYGGAPGQSRRYRLNLEKLATAGVDATPSVKATPSTDARDGLHGCTKGLAPMQAYPSLTIIEPSIESSLVENTEKQKTKNPRKKSESQTLQAFLDCCKADGLKPIPAGDPILKYEKDVKLAPGMVALAWFVFKNKYLADNQWQKDWRAHFRNAVKCNWYKLWYFDADGEACLTTAGQMAQREQQADKSEGCT